MCLFIHSDASYLSEVQSQITRSRLHWSLSGNRRPGLYPIRILASDNGESMSVQYHESVLSSATEAGTLFFNGGEATTYMGTTLSEVGEGPSHQHWSKQQFLCRRHHKTSLNSLPLPNFFMRFYWVKETASPKIRSQLLVCTGYTQNCVTLTITLSSSMSHAYDVFQSSPSRHYSGSPGILSCWMISSVFTPFFLWHD
jgi:hypothetical protein